MVKTVSQKQKADGLLRLYGDVSNLKFQKHERGVKKALNSRLRSEVVDPDVCQGHTTDEVKAILRNINPTKAAGPDKTHPRFLHHLGPVSIYSMTSIFTQQIVGGDQVPQEWSVGDIRPIPKGWKDAQKMESYRPIPLTSTVGKTMECVITNRL